MVNRDKAKTGTQTKSRSGACIREKDLLQLGRRNVFPRYAFAAKQNLCYGVEFRCSSRTKLDGTEGSDGLLVPCDLQKQRLSTKSGVLQIDKLFAQLEASKPTCQEPDNES